VPADPGVAVVPPFCRALHAAIDATMLARTSVERLRNLTKGILLLDVELPLAAPPIRASHECEPESICGRRESHFPCA